jgi:hypothetical protein
MAVLELTENTGICMVAILIVVPPTLRMYGVRFWGTVVQAGLALFPAATMVVNPQMKLQNMTDSHTESFAIGCVRD